jgi:hypothetical protein
MEAAQQDGLEEAAHRLVAEGLADTRPARPGGPPAAAAPPEGPARVRRRGALYGSRIPLPTSLSRHLLQMLGLAGGRSIKR